MDVSPFFKKMPALAYVQHNANVFSAGTRLREGRRHCFFGRYANIFGIFVQNDSKLQFFLHISKKSSKFAANL
jgi:hypothetical protein